MVGACEHGPRDGNAECLGSLKRILRPPLRYRSGRCENIQNGSNGPQPAIPVTINKENLK
jgi:hypothetical protein